jgi:hypothetical protein
MRAAERTAVSWRLTAKRPCGGLFTHCGGAALADSHGTDLPGPELQCRRNRTL